MLTVTCMVYGKQMQLDKGNLYYILVGCLRVIFI